MRAALTLAAAVHAIAGPASSPSSFGIGKSQIVISPTNETELLLHTVSPGVSTASINFFWITGDPVGSGPRAGVDYSVWRFYIDGEANASIVLQTSQAACVGQADPSAPWDNDLFGKNSKFGGWHINVPIPFTASVRVTLQLAPFWSGTERVFAMCRGVEGLPVQIAGFSLPPTARLVASVANASLAPLDFHELINIPAGAAGERRGGKVECYWRVQRYSAHVGASVQAQAA